MHGSVMRFIQRGLTHSEVDKKSVLEVGSYNVNGTIKDIILPLGPASYTGTDMRAGPCVDIVCDASNLVKEFGPDTFDIVVSTEMLEHAQDWRLVINQMKTVLKPTGIILITTRSPGFMLHDYPADYWRYTESDMLKIFADFNIDIVQQDDDTGMPGVFIKAHKPRLWTKLDLTNIEVAVAP